MDKFRESVEAFDSEFADFEQKHFEYTSLCEEIRSKQQSCLHDIKHYRLYIQMLMRQMQAFQDTDDIHEAVELAVIRDRFEAKKLILSEMEQSLPKKNRLYLNVVLGAVNVSFTTKQEKFAYKNNYENFKIIVSGIMALFALLLYICPPIRLMDSLFHFLLVWYYCTLTIREQILIQNGSKIKGWWATYHFILTALTAVMLIW
ncbi:unnamed protein product [Dibothriocephalus latus]|uniref:Transmembrane protein 120 homolog n=1 Tax=Dibothriocephalus latus TaxID=60516 RepID=A0A3P7L5W3_DIBLA|nr:unnamed protein product [Dibothriocephalus latus]